MTTSNGHAPGEVTPAESEQVLTSLVNAANSRRHRNSSVGDQARQQPLAGNHSMTPHHKAKSPAATGLNANKTTNVAIFASAEKIGNSGKSWWRQHE